MRQISKFSLLLAPLLMASAAGCAMPSSWLTKTDPAQVQEERAQRMMAVAQQFEEDGKPEAAMRVYEHLLAQQPQYSPAREHYDLLAKQGIQTGGRSLNPGSSRSGPTAQEMLASSESRKKSQRPTVQAQIREQNEAIARALAAKQSELAPPASSAPEEKIAAAQTAPSADAPAADTEFQIAKVKVSAPAAQSVAFEQPVAKPDATTLSTWTTAEEVATPAGNDATPATLSEHTTLETDAEWVAADTHTSPLPEPSSSDKPQLASLADDSGWQTTDLTRPVVQQASTKENLPQDDWGPTRLTGLCEDLPEHLVPVVTRLESQDAAERVSALLELGDLGEQARPAAVAVHALLEDPDPIVSVYAAGTLREIAGDAWSSVRTLIGHLQGGDERVTRLAAYLLGQMGPEAMDAVPALEELQNAQRGITSLHAAEALTHIAPDDHQSFQKLSAALTEKDREIRWFAAVSLGAVTEDCEPEAAQALLTALHDQEAEVRAAACLSLGGLGKHAAIAVSELEHAVQTDTPEVRQAAETALACLKN